MAKYDEERVPPVPTIEEAPDEPTVIPPYDSAARELWESDTESLLEPERSRPTAVEPFDGPRSQLSPSERSIDEA